MKNSFNPHPLKILLFCIITFFLAYYTSILLHEWSHGTTAWLLGQKTSPFDVYYGSWTLFNVDENVNYNKLLATHQGLAAALIGISGVTMSIILVILSLIVLNNKKLQNNTFIFLFAYWVFSISVVPEIQYFNLTTFSSEGDVGRFTHGLNISPWWIFIPGTLYVILIVLFF